jgi:hypothetical protein
MFVSGVNDTGDKLFGSVNDTGDQRVLPILACKLPPASTTPAANLLPVLLTNNENNIRLQTP